MPNDKWDDDRIENLLRDFPAIKDERPKEEVFNRLKNDHKPNKKPKRWIPMLVAALAFITFGVLLASMLGQNSSYDMSSSGGTEESADSGSVAVEESSEGGSEAMQAESETAESADSEENSEAFTSMENTPNRTGMSIYQDELDGQTLFTIGLTENALVIPVSFILPNESVLEDFGTEEVDSLELYNRYGSELDEESLGFDEYHPYSGSLRMTAEGLEHQLPEGHGYDMASAAMSVYFDSLTVTFNGVPQISIVDESGNPAEFDQVGPTEPIEPSLNSIAYYSYEAANGNTYLTPGFNMPHDNAEEALTAMKSSPSDLYFSLIPDEVDYTVSETAETVTVEFIDEALDFNLLDYQEAMRMIEGMVLAADSYGKELVLENTVAESWDRFDFAEPLPVPAGINLMEFTE